MPKVEPIHKNKKQKTQTGHDLRCTLNTFEDLTDFFLQHPTFKDRMSREQLFNILRFPHGLMTLYLIVSVTKKLLDLFTVKQLAELAGCENGFVNIYHQLNRSDLQEAGLLVNKGGRLSLLPWVVTALTETGPTSSASASSEGETQSCGNRSFASFDSAESSASVAVSTMARVDSALYAADEEFDALLAVFADPSCHPMPMVVTPELPGQTPSEATVNALASIQRLPLAVPMTHHVSATLQRP